jgi:CBS domain-containing protein
MNKEKAEQAQSLRQVAGAIGAHLQRLDLSSATEFLSGVSLKIDPLLERYERSQKELRTLFGLAARADDVGGLRAINDRLVNLAEELFEQFGSAPMVHEACTWVRGAIATRTLELSRSELARSGSSAGELPMALFSAGSGGRREQSLFAHQQYLFVYDGVANEIQQQSADSYFERLGSTFSLKLEHAGMPRLIPLSAEWRGSRQQWQRRVRGLVRYANEQWTKDTLNLIILSDARYVAGDRELGSWFGPFVRSTGQNTPQGILNMAIIASAMRLGSGFMRRFALEGEGEHKGLLNLEVLAWKPLTIGVEVLAVGFGVNETPTLERLNRLSAIKCLTPKLAAELTAAFHVISGLRIAQQIKKHSGAIKDDNYLNPYDLEPAVRDELSRALGSIEELQGVIRSKFSVP